MSKRSERRKNLELVAETTKSSKKPKKIVNEKLADASKKVPRDANGHYLPGFSGNPEGSVEGTRSYTKRLEEALLAVEGAKSKGKGSKRRAASLFKRFIERAFKDDKVLIAAMKKFVPDKEKAEVEMLEPIRLVIEHVRKKD